MFRSSLLRVALILLLGEWALAFAIRDSNLGFNSTTISTTASEASTTKVKIVIPTSSRAFKVHAESTATGFEDTSTDSNPSKETRVKGGGDVGSIIASVVEGWPMETGAGQRSHQESTVAGFKGGVTDAQPQKTPEAWVTGKPMVPMPVITNNGLTMTPVPATSVIIGTQTLTPGGATATMGEGISATRIHLDESGKPVVAIGDKTSTAQIRPSSTVINGATLMPGGSPLTVGSGAQATTYSINPAGETIAIANGAMSTLAPPPTQVFTIGDITATAQATSYQYLIDSSILAIGHPVTVSGTVISLTTDAAGATVLVAGDSSTTLASPKIMAAKDLGIATTVIDGTTEYIIDSQTLAPGHPVTVKGTVISISTSAGTTILTVGDKTTTLSGSSATAFDGGGSATSIAVATPGFWGGGGGAAATSKKGNAQPTIRPGSRVSCALALVIVVLDLG